MDRRVLTTCLACFLFTLLYWKIFDPRTDGEAGARPPASEVGAPGASGPGDASDPASNVPDGASPTGDAAPAVPVPVGKFQATRVGEIEVPPFENEHLKVTFTNRGGAVRQVWLKQHWLTAEGKKEQLQGEEYWISLFPERESYGDALAMYENVVSGRSARYGLEGVNWAVEDLAEPGGVRNLTFTYATADGLEFTKRISAGPGSHALEVEVGVRALDPEWSGQPYQTMILRATGGISDVERGWFTTEPQGVTMLLGRGDEPTVRQELAEGLEGDPVNASAKGDTHVAFVGASNLYFGAMLAPRNEGDATSAHLFGEGDDHPEKIRSELVIQIPVAKGGEPAKLVPFDFYLGPKDPRLLEDHSLTVFQPLIDLDYGSWESFRWINKLLLSVLRFFHDFTGNWGIGIILLTLVVRICMFPITRTQQLSMQRYSQKMQILKPKLDALRAKYKEKPQKFAQEQMKLLKEHNAKPPLLGCITIFITFPIFIAMFQILRTAVDLRQAPFVAWIDDLALPDAMFGIPGTAYAFNLLPILATVAFVGQMMMAPKAADPQAQQQQKIMYFMPILFGVMFYGYAAGLSLYMLTSSMWGMFEYKIIRQKLLGDAKDGGPGGAPVAVPVKPSKS